MTPTRTALAAAIARLTAAVAASTRVAEADRRLADQLFDHAQPAVTAAQKTLDAARELHPEAVLAAALGEPQLAEAPTVAAAERTLATAQRKVDEIREARLILATEATRAAAAVSAANHDRDSAVKRAIEADPAVAALRAEFHRAATRALRCAQALRTAGLTMGGAHMRLRGILLEAGAPVAQGAFDDDPEWIAAVETLRNDPDAPLPGLPPPDEPDPDDASAGDSSRAAA
jgi:hypothetical protein